MTTTITATESQTIAKTILAQIGVNSIMCMGVPRNSIHIVNPTIDTDPDKGHLGGVSFKFTNCPKVRSGTVIVTLSAVDDYTVTILNVRGREIFKAEGVYCDMLGGASGVIESVTG
jgi:hypothetical protein